MKYYPNLDYSGKIKNFKGDLGEEEEKKHKQGISSSTQKVLEDEEDDIDVNQLIESFEKYHGDDPSLKYPQQDDIDAIQAVPEPKIYEGGPNTLLFFFKAI